MMENQQFIDAEYCIDRYFDQHLTTKLDFYIDCRNAAVVGGMSSGMSVMNTLLPSEDYATNVTLNFPANDIEKTCADMGRDLQMTHDKQVLVTTWRHAAVGKIGQARYDELSRQLGVDLAAAYVDHRLLMRMVDYEVAKNPIRGSANSSSTKPVVTRCFRTQAPQLRNFSSSSTRNWWNATTLASWNGEPERHLAL